MSRSNIKVKTDFSDIEKKVNKIVNKYVNKAQKIVNKKVDKKAEKIRQFRREASRLASMANKRLARLEKNNLTDTPAYQAFLRSGGERFGIRGKSYNEVQKEMARIRRFINAETSTVRGARRVLKEIAKNTGIKYSSIKQLQSYSKQFFEIASKVEQYLRTVDDIASAIGYQKIWEQINQYVKQEKIDLSNAENDMDEVVEEITKALREYEDPIVINEGWFNAWFKLPKT